MTLHPFFDYLSNSYFFDVENFSILSLLYLPDKILIQFKIL